MKVTEQQVYKTWSNMIERCYSSKKGSNKYKYYRGRGIKVCNEWRSSSLTFIRWALNNGYKKGLEIDRINNDGNYEPNNCRFVTHQENCFNRGMYSNNTSGFIGVYKYQDKWSALIRVNYKSVFLGYFKSPILAACRRDVAALKYGYPTNF